MPIAFRILSCVRRKASGSYMVPVLGDGNRYRLQGCFLCSAISRSTARCGRANVRTELRVFGGLTTNSPLMRFTCLVTESVLLSTSNTVIRRTKLPGNRTVIRKLSIAPQGYAALSLPIAAQFLRCWSALFGFNGAIFGRSKTLSIDWRRKICAIGGADEILDQNSGTGGRLCIPMRNG